MTPERWNEVQAAFLAVADMPEDERAERLLEVCRGDDELRREVESLLAADARPSPALDRLPAALGAAASSDGLTEHALPTQAAAGPDLRRIGDYELLDVIGRGGMGVVYRAVNVETGETAAVKTVRLATEATLESIRREIHMLVALRHPGVVAIRDHGVSDGIPWYAMELLTGRTLRSDLAAWFAGPRPADAVTRDLRKPGQLRADRDPAADTASRPHSLGHVLELFRKLCEPLAYVHGQGVIHRDLSPANVFLIGDGDPVLFDFGLAAQFRTDSAREVLEVGGLTRGTPLYMAPEQARGEVVDARADVYALGCILYEALTGRAPFLGESSVSVILQHLQTAPRPPSTYAPSVPRALDELVMRMLAKAPRDRIGYVEDVAAALDALGAPRIAAEERTVRPRAYTYRPGLAGRAALIGELDHVLRALAGGAGGFVTLVGESGVGKTRLAGEIATRARDHRVRVITGECEHHGAPLHPLRPLLNAVADRCREGGPVEAERLLGPAGHVLVAYEPSLAACAAVGPDRTDLGNLGATATRARVLAVLRDALAALAAAEPLLLVLDDLQWADDLTLALLGSTRELASRGVFVLGTVRAEEMTPELDAALRAAGALRRDVPRLDGVAVGAMIRDMLALEQEAPLLTEYVTSQSAGNPLFAAEYIRLAVDEGMIRRDADGRWRLHPRDDESFDRLPTPRSVKSLVRRRLAGLTDTARAVAFAIAVLGRDYDPAILVATSGLVDAAARDGVRELLQRQIITEHADGDLRLAHDKLRELAYAELAEPARRTLHRRAATAIEARYRGDADLAQHLGELAHHWEQAGYLQRAADYLESTAEHALRAAAFGEARFRLEHLLALPIVADPIRRARWERGLGKACYALGDIGGLAAHSERALRQLGRPLPASRIRLAASVAVGVGQQLLARTLRRPLRRAGTDTEPLVEAALAAAQMTTHYFFNGDSLGLIGAALAAANLAEQAGGKLPIAEIYAQLGYAAGLARLGGVARRYFAHGRTIAAETRDGFGRVRVLLTEAAYGIGIGAWREARASATEALRIARELRDPQEAEDALTILGYIEFAISRYADSRALAIELRRSARARSNAQHEAWALLTEGRAALYLGDLAEAVELIDRASVMIESDRSTLILCSGMRASALTRAGHLERARAAADATSALIGNEIPPVFGIPAGLIGVADAYLELWRLTGDPGLDALARRAVTDLERFARLFPSSGPAAETAAGLYHARRGSPRRAHAALTRGLAGAIRLGLPYDQAIAHRALGQLGNERHAEAAALLFAELGCRWPTAAS